MRVLIEDTIRLWYGRRTTVSFEVTATGNVWGL